MNNLSISLSPEPKRYWKSKKKLILISICIILISLSVFRLWTCRDKITNTHPQNTILSIGIILTPSNSGILHENLGNKELLFGTGITWDKALTLADNQIGIHINQNGSILGIAIDRTLNDQEATNLELVGVDIQRFDKLTFISAQHEDLVVDNHFSLSLMPLWPFFDGYLSSTDEYGHISISKEKIIFSGLGGTGCDDFGQMYIPEDKIMIAMTCSSGDIQDKITNSLFPYLSLPVISDISPINQENPWKIALFANNQSKLEYSMMLNQTFEIDQLATLAKQLVSSLNLSTQALTTEDNSRYQELIADAQNINISISTENGSSFIHATTPSSSVNITQTNGYTLISNMDISQTLDNNESWNRVDIFADILTMEDVIGVITDDQFISDFSKIILSNNDLLLFW